MGDSMRYKLVAWLMLGAYVCAFGANKLDLLPYDERFDGLEVELLISYKVVSQDNLAQRERYRVSQVMQEKSGYHITKECEIDASRYLIMDDMPYFISSVLKQEKEQVLECLYGYEVNVRESTKGRNNAISSKVSLEIAPTRIRAKLVDKSIVMYILAKGER